jgi:hypothetical protein
MITGNGEWSTPYIIGTTALIIVILIGALYFTAVLFSGWDGEEKGIAFFTGGIVFLVIAGSLGAACYPFDAAHHKYYDVTGTVQTTNKRLVGNGDSGMSERYVIKFAESNTLYGCDDTRCSLAAPGKTVALKCKREWQYKGQDGWVCSYNQED